MRPISIPKQILKYSNDSLQKTDLCKVAFDGYQKLNRGLPEVSVVIPAYNEQENISATLASLCQNQTSRSIEIIVVDNNSTDDTQNLVRSCGVNCVFLAQQGITFARNYGLANARGKYILNADADTIYPENWIELMVNPLENENVALTYGRFALIPTGNTGRFTYFFYEYFTGLSRFINKSLKDEAVNVYGFNSGFRKSQGLSVNGFDHPAGTNEDGWLAVKLRTAGFGKLFQVSDPRAMVWTTDRRIQLDGGLWSAILKRTKRLFNI